MSKGSGLASIPWWVVITFLVINPVIGLILLALKSYGEKQTGRPARKKRKSSLTKAAIGMLCVGGLMLLGEVGSAWMWLVGGVIAGGAGMIKSQEESRYEKYMAVIGDRKVVSVRDIAIALKLNAVQVENELENMIEKNWYEGWHPYVDKSRHLFVLDAQFAPAPEQEPEPEVKKAEPAQPKEEEALGSDGLPVAYSRKLREIRHLNDLIADDRVSAAIDQIEAVTRSIFENVTEHPEKKDQISTFMNYYLPTTLKLLNAYAELERQPTAGANIVSSRERIEKLLDQLVWAFDDQLNHLFESEARDISTDIRVMEQMLARDGLAGKGMTMPKGKTRTMQ